MKIESYHDGVVAFDFDLQVLEANDMMAAILPGTWMDSYPCALQEVFPTISEEYEWLERMVSERICYRNHVHNFARKGKLRTLLVDSYFLRNENGEYTGMCVFFKDIGNLVNVEQQMHHNEKLATVGKIAAGVAHEIRNPLTSIKGFLQMMRSELESHGLMREYGYTKVMLTEIERINELVGELLLLSKPRELRMEFLDVEELLTTMVPLISSEALLHNIAVRVNLKSTLDVYGDREVLKQVFLNLVKNAFEAMEDTGGGEVRIDTEYLPDEHMVRVDVIDSGPGIPHYMVDRIFDAFFTTKETGTGLGLPICQRLISDLGGHIKVKSKGFGTTFSVFLPVRKSE
ncbi:MAG: two-component system sensor histidine kinase NtrB [Tumebacillaceae bacterium]